MRNGKYCIAITCVGSGVGQSVITSCNLSKLPLITVGFDMNPLSFGAYECNEMGYLPGICAPDYIDVLIEKCKMHDVDLIIPGLDDEALLLSENLDTIEASGIKVIVSKPELLRLVRDKEKMTEEFSSIADIFVKTFEYGSLLKAIEKGQAFFPLIAKPRGGSGSRGVEIILNEADLAKITENHIIQELAVPRLEDPFREKYLAQIEKRINPQFSEISIQIVTDKNGNILGKMASYNKLKDGVPIEIIPYESEYVWSEIEKLIPRLKELGHRGPLNIQGRWTNNGLKLFEMNARFTGITGLRAIMGFNEVECCIKDWLDIGTERKALHFNYDRFGIRQTTDKSVSLCNNSEVKTLSNLLNQKELKPVKTVMVTGAGGYLGQNLVKRLAQEGYNVFAFSRSKGKILPLFNTYENIKCFDLHDLDLGILNLGMVDYLIHCGFARPHCTNEEIADSLVFTNRLFGSATIHQIPCIINISSQSVYGTKQKPLWTEQTPVSPETVYAQAKQATELMAENVHYLNKHTFVTSLRLSTLTGGQEGLFPGELTARFVEKTLKQEPLTIFGGQQRMERLDVRDAVAAVIALINTDYHIWEPVYNLGSCNTYSVLEIAEAIKGIAENKYDKNVKIEIQSKNESFPSFGMDSSEFRKLTNWVPIYELVDSIDSLFKYFSTVQVQ